jgi:hypothetical protein
MVSKFHSLSEIFTFAASTRLRQTQGEAAETQHPL